jgi:hypothetical protein
VINRVSPFTKNYIFRNKYTSRNYDIPVKIVVCGEESVSLASTDASIIVNELLTTGSSYKVNQTTLNNYFTVASAGSAWCGKLKFSVFKDSAASQTATHVNMKQDILVTPKEDYMAIDSDKAINKFVYL